jgi:hypothetical protein
LGRKKKSDLPQGPKPNDGWAYLNEIQINGRHVSKGTELKVTGERGRFRFVQQVTTSKGVVWIDVFGGPKNLETMRSFYPDRIKRVHYKNQTTANLAIEHKEKMAAKKAELEVNDDE